MSQYANLKVTIQHTPQGWQVITCSGHGLGTFGWLKRAENVAHRYCSPVKARRDYQTLGCDGPAGFKVAPERVRVTGFQDVNGERWCRVRYAGDRSAKVLMHPNELADV